MSGGTRDYPGFEPGRPTSGPSAGSVAERDAFAALVNQSLPAARASAAAWRNGLTAFLTLVTTGVVIKGRDTMADMPTSWRIWVSVLIGLGLALAVAGLWLALAAHAGTRGRMVSLDDIHRDYGSVAAFEVILADEAASKLRTGRLVVAAALLLLLTGIGLTWWAPPTSPVQSADLKVTTGRINACGVLQSADGGEVRLAVPGAHDLIVIPLTQITNLAVVAKCSP